MSELITSERYFEQWMRGAAPGARAVYHEGSLACDRHKHREHPRLSDLATAVLKADARGYVMAAQRPSARGGSVYIVVRLRRPLPD